MPTRTALSCVTFLLALPLAGCGGPDDGPGDVAREKESSASTPSAEPTSPDPTSPAPTTTTTTPPSEGLEKVRVVGEVRETGDCVVVEDDDATTWTITGDLAAGLAPGDRVQVTGTPDLVATGCGGPVVQATVVTVVG